jgi:RNase P protein component
MRQHDHGVSIDAREFRVHKKLPVFSWYAMPKNGSSYVGVDQSDTTHDRPLLPIRVRKNLRFSVVRHREKRFFR